MKLSEEEIQSKLGNLKDWTYNNNAIHKTFEFSDFRQAFAVMTQVALMAEKMDHHPDWSNVYNTLNVALSTHSEGGVTDKDIKLATHIEECVKQM